MMSSREAVVVDFDNENEGEGGSLLQSSTTSPQTDEEDMSMEDSQTMTPPTPPMPREKLMRFALPATKLHIAVLAKRQSTRVPGFIPKQQFKLRLPKDKRGARTHYVTICGGVENTRSQEDLLQHSSESQLSSDISDMIWTKVVGVELNEVPHFPFRCVEELPAMQQSPSPTAFASLEERIAHLNWRKICNERQIQGTLRFSKQLQERDEFIRAAKSGNKVHRERMQQVIKDEFTKPLPVTAQFYDELTALQREDELKAQKVAERHMTQLHNIQTKLDAREAQLTRKKEFERKKKDLFAGD
ncbi:unnamed protein product [Phytophthora lilii]|uniref:Unnamed protein product n=1 Tax=Phytophthora lilii TaxID=2077276 RepID=A0A9W6YIE7_9STRA|nr:unnamed protein product [Phytophthora lilii]